MTTEEPPYKVVKQQDTFCVEDSGGRTVVTCHSELNAQHYAELLTRAYTSGYKAGFKRRKTTTG